MKFLLFFVSILIPSLISPLSSDSLYTQSLSQFKGKGFGARKQKLIGCWLLIEHSLINHRQIPTEKQKQPESKKYMFSDEHIGILKQCMKRIEKKYAVQMITSLVSKQSNDPPLKLSDLILNWEVMIAQVITLSQFDQFLLAIINKYQSQLNELDKKGGIHQQIQGKLNKKTDLGFLKYFYMQGPTKTIFLVNLGVLMLLCCLYCRYNRIAGERIEAKAKQKRKNRQQMKEKKQTKMERVQKQLKVIEERIQIEKKKINKIN